MSISNARIVHVHSTFDHGGKEGRTVTLINNLNGRYRHSLWVGDGNVIGAYRAIQPPVTLAIAGKDTASIFGLPSPWRYYRLAAFMAQFDLIATYGWGAMDVVMAHRLYRKVLNLPRLIHHEDGFDHDEVIQRDWKRNRFRQMALPTASAVIVPSNTLQEIAVADWNIRADTIHKIANGVAVKACMQGVAARAISDFRQQPDDIIIGTVAGLRPVKNLPRLVRAVAAAGRNVRLVIMGDGPAKADILAEATRLGIADRLTLMGFVDEPYLHLKAFDIFALSSDSEQFPISLVEAMAANLPIVATDVGDIRDMVARINLPYIVPVTDELALSKAITMLAANTALRHKIGAANNALAAALYSDQTMFEHYAKIYQAMISAD